MSNDFVLLHITSTPMHQTGATPVGKNKSYDITYFTHIPLLQSSFLQTPPHSLSPSAASFDDYHI